ncbi:DUF3618 domain-containing protein [Ornithinimicrobium sp. INDO-MA30-4]|uniref:DUF3618 domain-containing protein n=1 Tax=Ornithinimicrobium sp. INDO-MA30-4 TaxID=2908651 RepID=UPI001F386FEB|nr:DUF3618 domain-containing protein [Ornithinimicrobium sp. INDO-MA30-4]UJH69590.1 DUF3618 domain-containing protein [Ornithinimicrobium sp. INDO-MA30-4]
MSTANDTDGVSDANSAANKDPEQIEADIARHRQELSHTVDELTQRLDVKKQAQHKMTSAKAEVSDRLQATKVRAQAADPAELAAMAAPALAVLAAVILALGLIRRRRQ